MKYFHKALLGFLAFAGAAALLAFAYVFFFLPKCQITRKEDLPAPGGEFIARIEGRVCEDVSKTKSIVYIGRISDSQWNVATEIFAQPFDIELKWENASSLSVSVPSGTRTQSFGIPDSWPRLNVARKGSQQ